MVSMSAGSPGHGTSARGRAAPASATRPPSPSGAAAPRPAAARRTGFPRRRRRWPRRSGRRSTRPPPATPQTPPTAVAQADDDGVVAAGRRRGRRRLSARCACPRPSGLRTVTSSAAARRSTAPATTTLVEAGRRRAAATAHATAAGPEGASSLWAAAEPAPAPGGQHDRRGRHSSGWGRSVSRRDARPLPAGAQGDDLGADRDRRLLGRAGADVEADGRHHPGEPASVDALLAQPPTRSSWVRREPIAPR